MAVAIKLPARKELIVSEHIFTANFNNPTLGKYDFGTLSNQGSKVVDIEKNAVFIIDRMSIGGNIAEEVFNDSIDEVPSVRFRMEKSGEYVQAKAIPVVNYIDDKDLSFYFNDDKLPNQLNVDFKGVLKQTSSLVGIAQIKIIVTFSVFKVTDVNFVKHYKDIFAGNVGEDLRY